MFYSKLDMELRRARIDEARRTGLRNRIRDEWHVPEHRADALLEAWAVEAASTGITTAASGYWGAAEGWVRDRLAGKPPTEEAADGIKS